MVQKQFHKKTPLQNFLHFAVFVLLGLVIVMVLSENNLAEEKDPEWSYSTDGEILRTTISADGDYAAIGSYDNKFYLFSKDSSTPLWSYEAGDNANCVALSSDGEYLAAGCADGEPTVFLFQKDSSDPVWTCEVEEDIYGDKGVERIDISADGDYIVAGSSNDKMYFFHKDSSTPQWTYTCDSSVRAISMSSDGEYIAMGSADKKLRLFNKNSSTPEWTFSAGDTVGRVSISADGEYIAAVSYDKHVYLFNKDSSIPIWTYDSGVKMRGVSISSDGRYIAASDENGRVYLFEKESSTPKWEYTTGAVVHFVSLSGDGFYLVVGSYDDSVYFFSTENSTPQWTYKTGGDVNLPAISFNGQYVVTPSFDNSVYFFKTNVLPIPYIDVLTPQVAVLDELVELQGHGEDENDKITEFSWESDVDGVIGTDASIALSSLSLGTHTISFNVKDDEQWGKAVFETLVVHERPVAEITSISPNPALLDDQIQFTGEGTDDGSVERYVWKSDLDGEIYNDTSDSFETTALSLGSHTITFLVQDNHDAWSHEVELLLRVHERPTAEITEITPSPALVAEEVIFTGKGEDDGSVERYVWESDVDGELDNDTLGSFPSSELSRGEHTISLRVQDDLGVWSMDVTQPLLVHDRPIAHIVSVSRTLVPVGEVVEFTGSGEDDGSIALYVWRSSIDDEFYNDTGTSFEYADFSPGEHSIYFLVMDGNGVWSEEVEVSLRVGVIPVAVIDEIKPEDAWEGDDVWFYGNGSDDDGVVEEYEWRFGDSSGGSTSFGLTGLNPGAYSLSFRVRDDDGLWSDPATLDFEMLDVEPVAFIDLISPDSPKETDSITMSGHASEFGLIAAYSWESDLDGVLGTETSLYLTLSPGLHEISFKVQDDEGGWSEPVQRKIWVNDIPVASIKDGYPETMNAGDMFEIEGEAEDLGGITEYRWESDLDGTLGTEADLKWSDLSAGVHLLSFMAMDNQTVWSLPATATVTVNAVPVAAAGPDIHSFPHLEVQFTGQGLDPDGSIVKYEWDFDGNGIYEWSSTETGLTKYTFNNPGEFNAVLRVTDNTGASSTDDLVVTVDTNLSAEADGAGYLPTFTAPISMLSIGLAGALVAFFRSENRAGKV